MKRLFHLPILILTILCAQSCDILESHPYDAYVRGEKNLNEKNIKLIEENLKDKKSFRIASVSYTHLTLPTT